MSDLTTDPKTDVGSGRTYLPLRVWPVVLLMGLMVLLQYLPSLMPDGPGWLWMSAAFGPTLCGIGVLFWWVTFSRATGRERAIGSVGLLVGLGLVVACMHPLMYGPGILMLTIPVGLVAFGVATVLLGRMLGAKRTVIATLVGVLGFGFSILVRHDGTWGDFTNEYNWRWSKTPEQLMLASGNLEAESDVATDVASRLRTSLENPQWTGFRGPLRTGVYSGAAIKPNWSSVAPRELWSRSVGPGWSSFAVAGEFVFTQEQRGKNESVVCYDGATGDQVWSSSIEARFEESLGGAGPRSTPTLAGNRLFALGGDGDLICLDPNDGRKLWEVDIKKTADRTPPPWGFASSPLVVGSTVIVHAGGMDDKGTLGFDVETGDLKWSAPSGDHSYASPQLCVINDQQVVVMLTNVGLELLDPVDGGVRLQYEWPGMGYRSLQPTVVNSDTILIPTESGTRCLKFTFDGDQFKTEELWTSGAMKPDFNDLVVFEDHLYGFTGNIFTCVDVKTGKRVWKGGRYGKGQVLLLEKSELLLVASEKGDAILLKADPGGHQELAKFKAIDGKTWNHPVVVGDRLYIRNAQIAACLQLTLADPSQTP